MFNNNHNFKLKLHLKCLVLWFKKCCGILQKYISINTVYPKVHTSVFLPITYLALLSVKHSETAFGKVLHKKVYYIM